MKVSRFEENGKQYEFQPPIDVGDRTVDSLHELVTIAIMGPSTSDLDVALGTIQTTESIHRSGEPQKMLAALLEGKHVVTIS